MFKLKPKGSTLGGVSFTDLDVTIVGKMDPRDKWIEEKTAKGDGTLIAFCAPSVDALTHYEYEVHVDELGMLDPRVDVKQ